MIDVATIGQVVVVLVSLTGAGVAIWNANTSRRSAESTNAKSLAEAHAVLVLPLTMRVESLERLVTNLEKENKVLKARLSIFEGGVVLLVSQLRALGHAPLWTPPTEIA